MRTGWTQPRNRIAKIVIDAINGQEFDQAPGIEQLEPRVLLSANPLSDILKPNEQAYTIQAYSNDSTDAMPKARSVYSAPSSNYTLPNASHLNGTIDIDLAILSGSNTVKEWGMNLVDRETGAMVASIASGSSAGNFKVALDTTLFEDGQYYLQVTVRDETGRGSNSNRQITLDNTAPVANISSPSYDAEVSGMVVVRGTINDSTGDSNGLVWDLDLRNTETGEIFSLCNDYRGAREPNGMTALAIFEPLHYPAGSYELVLTVTDRAGNATTTTLSLNIVEPPASSTGPKVTISHNAESTMTQGQTVEITVSSPSPSWNIRSMWLMVNGKKVDLLRQNNRVCIEMDCEHKLLEAEQAQNYSYVYASIIAQGEACLLESLEEKKHALLKMMEHLTGRTDFVIPEAAIKHTMVCKILCPEFTGKRRPPVQQAHT